MAEKITVNPRSSNFKEVNIPLRHDDRIIVAETAGWLQPLATLPEARSFRKGPLWDDTVDICRENIRGRFASKKVLDSSEANIEEGITYGSRPNSTALWYTTCRHISK